MKIFLSHSSRDKALVREIRSYLPRHIKAWLDEDELLIGKQLQDSIRNAIQEEADFVVIFLGQEAVASKWVKKELEWALDHEQKIGMTFVLPVLLDDVWDKVEPEEFRKRFHLRCFDQSEAGVRDFSNKLSEQLFAWLSQRLDDSKAAELKEQREAEVSKAAGDALIDLTKEETWQEALSKNLATDYDELTGFLEGIPDATKILRIEERLQRLIEKRRELMAQDEKLEQQSKYESNNDEQNVGKRMWNVITAAVIAQKRNNMRKHLSLLEELDKNIKALKDAGNSPEQILTYIRKFMLAGH